MQPNLQMRHGGSSVKEEGFWSWKFRFCWIQTLLDLGLSKNVTNHRTENSYDPRATLARVKLQQFLIKTISVILLLVLI
jgi:hypothetical protein